MFERWDMDEFQEQMQKIAEAAQGWNRALEPIRAEAERWAEVAKNIFQPVQDDFAASAIKAAQGLHREVEEHARQVEALYEQTRAATAEFASQMQHLAVPEWLNEVIHELSKRTHENLRALASRGWYLDPEIAAAAPTHLREAIGRGELQEVDEALMEWFRKRIDGIRGALATRHPDRAGILGKAFEAHLRGDYELSVPILLIQVDGICWDKTKLSPFTTRDKIPKIASFLKTYAADAYRQALLSPLMEVHPIGQSQDDRPAGFDGLNRHQVLHGESSSYASEVNSLKAISLLNYISWVLSRDPTGGQP